MWGGRPGSKQAARAQPRLVMHRGGATLESEACTGACAGQCLAPELPTGKTVVPCSAATDSSGTRAHTGRPRARAYAPKGSRARMLHIFYGISIVTLLLCQVSPRCCHCISMHTHTCTHTHAHACIYTHTHTHTHTHTRCHTQPNAITPPAAHLLLVHANHEKERGVAAVHYLVLPELKEGALRGGGGGGRVCCPTLLPTR